MISISPVPFRNWFNAMSMFAANVKVSNQIRHECAIERVSEVQRGSICIFIHGKHTSLSLQTRNGVTPDPQCFISSVNEGVQTEVLIEFFHLVTTVEYCDMTVPRDLTMPPPYGELLLICYSVERRF